MADGTDLGYDTGSLRAGSGGLDEVSGTSDAAGRALQAAPLEAVMFGRTPGAAAFAAVVQAAREGQARGFRQEAERCGGLGADTAATAAFGDDLTARTAGIARSATPEPQ